MGKNGKRSKKMNILEKSNCEKYHDLVNVILHELHHKKRLLQQGMFTKKQDIDEISGAIKQLETLTWYIESNKYEEQEND